MPNIVEDFYAKYNDLIGKLQSGDDLSLHVWATDFFRRILVIVMANYLENEVNSTLQNFFDSKSGNLLISEFSKRSMKRQYHTYFDWDSGTNANQFFALFGRTFKDKAKEDVRTNADLDEGIRAFLEIGRTRNILVHQGLHSANIEKTADEFYDSFAKAIIFMNYLRTNLV